MPISRDDEYPSPEYKRLILFVQRRHRELHPSHFVIADTLAVWCNTCQKGIGAETDGPLPISLDGR